MPNLKQLRYRASQTAVRVPVIWYRHRGCTRSDAFVAAYPRSGSTWLRFLLFEMLCQDSAVFTNVNRVIADIGYHREAPPLLPNQGRLLKTHEPYRREYKKAIYLVRDGRDVVLSEFAYQKARGWIRDDFDAFLDSFLRGRVSGYGSWAQHVQSWMESPLAAGGNLLTLRFEDMRANAEKALADIAAFLGVSIDAAAIRSAIQNNTLKKMQSKEDRTPQFSNLPPNNGNGLRFVRSGAVGGWRGRLSEAQLQLIDQHAGATLEALGYSSGTSLATPGVDVQMAGS